MAVSILPQLVEGQAAALDVGVSVPCRVIGFSGSDVVLALGATLPETLDVGHDAYLLVESEGNLQAVRGRVGTPVADELVLRLTDDIRLGQRRLFSRAPVPLPARLTDSTGRTWSTVTRDVSAGGVRIARDGESPAGELLELELQIGGHDVHAGVRVMRVTAEDVGLRFERIEREDRLLLTSLALAYHRRA
jgi:PilZ domain